MIFKYNFSITGDNFYPPKILDDIQGDFIIDTYFCPIDKKFENKLDTYGYGHLSFWHKNKFSTERNLAEYENDFINFIELNHSLFTPNRVTDLEIFIEIYFDGGQCNFEIFNKKLLKQIGDLGVALPISVYVLKDEEIKIWEDDINSTWDGKLRT